MNRLQINVSRLLVNLILNIKRINRKHKKLTNVERRDIRTGKKVT
nr:MAG TPA: hypothetical protein [Caudoviricetes sp.]